MLRLPAVHEKLITTQRYQIHQLGISWRRGEQNHCLLTEQRLLACEVMMSYSRK